MKKQVCKKLGLALTGGGGRGAYQVGIFKALLETKLFDKIHAISGTSVGALNEVLFLHKNYALANYIWRCKIEQSILYLDKERFNSTWDSLRYNVGRIEDQQSHFLGKFKEGFIKKGFKAGIFSRDGLIDILQNELDLSLVFKSKMELYATATHAASKNIEYFHLNKLPTKHTLIDVLLASSAIPGIFGHHHFNDGEYYDGGIVNNVPLDILYESGCDVILVCHLFRVRDKVDHSRYPNAQIIELTPEQSLGGMTGMLDFSPKSVRNFMERGYRENVDIIHSLGSRFTFKARSFFG